MPEQSRPELFVLCGPSAVGKGTVVKCLSEQFAQRFFLSISATTRQPREGEIDGRDYLFITKPRFEEMVAQDQMLEWAQVHGDHYYGTPRQPVVDCLSQGRPALLEIDLAGARQVRENWPQARLIFLAPPSWEELKRRLVGRGTETAEQQARRIETARVEMAAQHEFDLVICNDNLDQAVSELAEAMALA